MIVSFPLLAGQRAVAQAIASSGVSDIEDEAGPDRSRVIVRDSRVMAWRTVEPPGNPYLNPAPTCPECGGRVVRASGCIGCPACGWGKCG